MLTPDEEFFKHPLINPRYLKKNYPEFYEYLINKYIERSSLRRYHRSSFTKDAIVKRGWKENKDGWTEKDVMLEHGYFQLYDSGQTKWLINFK